ncbi:hypothetical protein D3C71_1306750 [compost metagenome]
MAARLPYQQFIQLVLRQMARGIKLFLVRAVQMHGHVERADVQDIAFAQPGANHFSQRGIGVVHAGQAAAVHHAEGGILVDDFAVYGLNPPRFVGQHPVGPLAADGASRGGETVARRAAVLERAGVGDDERQAWHRRWLRRGMGW